MALFRRRPPSQDLEVADESLTEGSAEASPDDAAAGRTHRPDGPYDESEADRADQSLARLDFGALRVPVLSGVGVQVEANRTTQQVVLVTGVGHEAAVQLQVFAAPRSDGLWDEIRKEAVAEISATADARVTETEGPFGPELRAVLPGRSPEGKPIRQAVRFVGIDGPRWFLRAVFLGRAAADPDVTDDLHRLVRETIVVRGREAMAPRDPLPLHLPAQPAADESAAAVAPAEDDDETGPSRFDDLDPFERGPEITETR